jgi:hypothetical protein
MTGVLSPAFLGPLVRPLSDHTFDDLGFVLW